MSLNGRTPVSSVPDERVIHRDSGCAAGTSPKPVLALLLAQHEAAVNAARAHGIAPRGTETSRKKYFAWQTAEKRFVESLTRVVGGINATDA